MSESIRTPGRIDEETTPVDGSTSSIDSGHVRPDDTNRQPGRVEDPSEAMPDDQSDRQALGIMGPELAERSLWKLVFWLLSLGIFIWLFYEVASGIISAWHQSIWFGLPLSILACIFLVVFGRASHREYKALKTIDTLAERRVRMRTALASNNLTKLRDTLEPTLEILRQRNSSLIAEFEAAAKSRETPSEYLKQFENIVLTQLDKEANAVIQRSALVGGVVIAIVPHPAFDAAVALWRATALIRKIGEIYGLEPTGLSSLRLLKHSITTAIIAAGTDISIEFIMEQVVQDTVNRTFSSLAEGSITAARLYHLGTYAQKLSRPMPI